MIKNCFRYSIMTLFASILLYSSNCEAADARSLMNGKFNVSSKSERADIAKDILSKIDSLNSYLPIMKPSEIAWLKEEEAAIDKLTNPEAALERHKQFTRSPEYQLQQFKLLLNELQGNLKCVINKRATLKSEMLCWSIVSYNLPNRLNFHDPLMYLKQHGRLPEDIGKKIKLYIRDNRIIAFDWYARGIQKYIITPYVAETIK